jgi:hypothetical protein
MKHQIDLKSLLIGILLTICVFMVIGASQSSFPPNFGRYQLVANAHTAYVIDGHTGRIWKWWGKSEFTEMKINTKLSAENNR